MPLEFQWYTTSTYERIFLTTVTSLERDSATMLSLHVTVSPRPLIYQQLTIFA